MATTYRNSNELNHSGNLKTLTIKQEPAEETRENFERGVKMRPNNGLSDPSGLTVGPQSVIMGMDYHYSSMYEQRNSNAFTHAPLQQFPLQQQREEIHNQDKHQKELNNYVLQNTIPSPLHRNVNLPEADAQNNDPNSEVPVLKMKRSNGKLALPEILHGNATKNIDLATLNSHQRAKREFVPENKKDEGYWNKRVKNNDSARRSRVKRKALEKIMETRLVELQQENIELRHEMNALKRRFGILDEITPVPTYGSFKASLDSVFNGTSSSPEKLSKDDELEQQSSASDDSRSLDDCRSSYNVQSVSVLSQSLDPANRERTDSMGSSSSGSVQRSPNSSSPTSNWEYSYVKTDQSGALDLTNDMGSRPYHNGGVPSPQTLPIAHNSETDSCPPYSGDKMDSCLRGIPLKCRWKYSSSTRKHAIDSSGSFPRA